MCFTITLIEKTAFQTIKTSSYKSRKIGIFPKGLVHDFCHKLAIFSFVYFRENRPGKCVLRYSLQKKRLSIKKVEKLGFFKRSQSMIFVKSWQFFHLLILVEMGQEKVFYNILFRKNAFLDYKNIKLKKSKNWHFSKGVSP